MVTQEEMRATLSLDTSVLGRAKRDIADFSQSGHSGFVHAGNAARGFHKMLHQITEASPMLGTALTAVLSPVNAALVAAGAALVWFNRQLEQWNAEMDKAETRNATAVFGVDAIRSAAAEQHKMATEHEKFMGTREDATKQFVDALDLEEQKLKDNLDIEKERLKLNKELAAELIRQQVSRGTMSTAAGTAAMRQLGLASAGGERVAQYASLDARRKALETAGGQAADELSGAKANADDLEAAREENSFELRKQQAEAADRQRSLEAALAEQKRIKGMSGAALMLDPTIIKPEGGPSDDTSPELWGYHSDITNGESLKERLESEADAKVAAARRELDEKKRLADDLQQKQNELNASYDETKEKVTKWGTALEDVNKKAAKTKEEQDKLAKSPGGGLAATPELSSPYEFSTSGLGQYNTYYGAVAREILRRQQIARYATAAGRPDIARDIGKSIDPSGGKDSLYGLLPAGLTNEQNAAQRQQKFIEDLIGELNRSGEGVPVKVTSIPNGS